MLVCLFFTLKVGTYLFPMDLHILGLLKETVMDGEQCTVVPKAVWDMLLESYGAPDDQVWLYNSLNIKTEDFNFQTVIYSYQL